MPTLIKNGRIAESSPQPELTLQPTDDPGAAQVAGLQVVAINFPKFGDGRGYSLAKLLRERYRYKGELRAVGEVARDNLFYLRQCGFDAFALRDGEDALEALAAFRDFSEPYQGSVADPRPHFKRRRA